MTTEFLCKFETMTYMHIPNSQQTKKYRFYMQYEGMGKTVSKLLNVRVIKASQLAICFGGNLQADYRDSLGLACK